ncbi:hypothetical protein [Granulicella tundricola]|uniref:Uncharacterized protein n=1 Tax=Granulicella tundricola (strain ATCC BAA-1859 / DSM 23138 / MP5ACTX9) TaxID=1198114 RepID=E8X6D4_GRATM|nr:hypothetical protein [Granulicella tundricola]ADW71018.1 hypothetical protein AciX9_4242 [Granulicella tundricola MP5ACTX9]
MTDGHGTLPCWPTPIGVGLQHLPWQVRSPPITDQTRGHGTHTMAAIWQQYLVELLTESEPR